MKRTFQIALILACCATAMPRLRAQSAPPTQNTQPANQQKPDAAPPKPSDSNQFPEDTSAVPVVPTSDVPAAPPPDVSNDGAAARLPGEDADPVRSPDDPAPDAKGSDGFSSSLQGADELKPIPDEEKPGKHAKGTEAPTHTEGAAGDINIGGYYLERKNWRAALSRFESALVLDPENPEVYWGMAEAQSHLGDYAKARENYKKLLEYDPDGKHGKEARKALKEPQIANAH